MKKLLFATSFLLALTLGSIQANENIDDLAQNLVVEFVEAIISGPAELAPMLAPEYQIMRSNGIGYNREEYLGIGLRKLSIKPSFSPDEIVATSADDILVVRYILEVDETIDGVKISKRAPRLTVFRLIDKKWKVVSHSNFAKHKN